MATVGVNGLNYCLVTDALFCVENTAILWSWLRTQAAMWSELARSSPMRQNAVFKLAALVTLVSQSQSKWRDIHCLLLYTCRIFLERWRADVWLRRLTSNWLLDFQRVYWILLRIRLFLRTVLSQRTRLLWVPMSSVGNDLKAFDLKSWFQITIVIFWFWSKITWK